MRLKQQVMLISLLLLSLPWAGCQFVREIDATVRVAQEQTLSASARAVAASLANQPQLFQQYARRNRDSDSLYFEGLNTAPEIDGYDPDWEGSRHYALPDRRGHFRTGIHGKHLYGFIAVRDNLVTYHNPSLSYFENGDRVEILSSKAHYFLATSAPGKFRGFHRRDSGGYQLDNELIANWQPSEQGFNIEFRLPLAMSDNHLFVSFIDGEKDIRLDLNGAQFASGRSLSAPRELFDVPPIIAVNQALNDSLAVFGSPGTRLSVWNNDDWIIATTGGLRVERANDSPILRSLYKRILGDGDTALVYDDSPRGSQRDELQHGQSGRVRSHWYQDPASTRTQIVATAVPIRALDSNGTVLATVIAEQNTDRFADLIDGAFNQLFVLSFSALLLTALALVGFAALLSWRVGKLNRSVKHSVNDKGQIVERFEASPARDELGELSRNYGDLLGRVNDYTDYLQTLSRKLSHELRTPLAIVQSSLDNLGNQSLDETSQRYQTRASEGSQRLGAILSAMGEASRVEEAIQHSEKEAVNLVQLVRDVSAAYSDIYTTHTITMDNSAGPEYTIACAPDLLVQLLDKLVQNAADFCPENGSIIFGIMTHQSSCQLSVANDGPLLPEKMQGQLFDNMVSMRERNDSGTHLGLGLYIAKLIADFHGWRIWAENRRDQAGVVFTVEISK